ncbi:hypothetical protein L596_024764 [Steinernema carpocapsae]|uniref:Uncharacterized protein n=1 Tax=Steinernema carpocapsae TaxID=34508 RepID=A0A4V5ZYL1_STECR|nr:hypothetical protein L596_024764 [Steinernema carpocapsae]
MPEAISTRLANSCLTWIIALRHVITQFAEIGEELREPRNEPLARRTSRPTRRRFRLRRCRSAFSLAFALP